MISLQKQLVLAATAVLLTACGGGGGSGSGSGSGTDSKPASLTDASVQASISSAVSASSQPFRWELTPTVMPELAVVVPAGQSAADLQVLMYRYTEETLGDGTVIQVPGDLVGSAVTDADGKAKLDLIADKTENVLVEVLRGPVKLEYQGKSYRIVKVSDLGTLAFSS